MIWQRWFEANPFLSMPVEMGNILGGWAEQFGGGRIIFRFAKMYVQFTVAMVSLPIGTVFTSFYFLRLGFCFAF